MFEAGLEQLEACYAERIERYEAKDAHIYGRLAAMRALGAKVIDVQLAAQALARDATLATRNVKDFAWTGVRVVNPWNG
jgi:predicted nucleic acid-binding protein